MVWLYSRQARNPAWKVSIMPSYQVTVPHQLGQDSARSRVETFLESVQREYAAHVSNVSGEWSGNGLAFRFLASGLNVSGTLVVEESLVVVTGPLPLAALFFRGQIERTIRDELQRLLQ
jgi:Putative polyhydroxyalkanoic acid system protein (PHA_gran_rgn)